MRDQAGYTVLQGHPESHVRYGTVVLINGTPVPAAPLGSCLVLLVGLIMWPVGMMQARSTVDGIFSDLGLTPDALEHLKATVLVSVVVLTLLAVVALVANVVLEVTRLTGTTTAAAAGALGHAQAYSSRALGLNVANWLLLLLAALALSGSITWLTTMSSALTATQQATGGFSSITPSHHTTVTTTAAALAGQSHHTMHHRRPLWASRSVGRGAEVPDMAAVWRVSTCPPGCVDLGLVAQLLGLPWPCFCQVWLLRDLEQQLEQVVHQLWVAVSGAVLLFVAMSWLYGYLAAQGRMQQGMFKT